MSAANKDVRLSDPERRELLRLARESIGAVLDVNKQPTLQLETPALTTIGGAFVTLELLGNLRGCVGTVNPRDPLHLTVISMAKAAAFEDMRFPALKAKEFGQISIEISRLTPAHPVRPDQVIPGRHGLLVSQGPIRGLLLPQVAERYGWDRERFLRETCRKAGLAPDAWKDTGTEILAFEAEVFGEQDLAAGG